MAEIEYMHPIRPEAKGIRFGEGVDEESGPYDDVTVALYCIAERVQALAEGVHAIPLRGSSDYFDEVEARVVKAEDLNEELLAFLREFKAASSERELDALWMKADTIIAKIDGGGRQWQT